MRVLGVIPARRNSKSIKGKNVAPLCGKPLVSWTFEAAKESVWLSRIVCSTDCPQVAALADAQGIEVIDRPAKLAQDDTPMVPVLQHALSVAGEQFDACMLLQPTCPLRRTDEIDGAVMLMNASKCSSVISYVDVGANHPARMVAIDFDVPVPIWNPTLRWGERFDNKQDLRPIYLRSGDIYLTKVDVLMRGDLLGDKPRAYMILPERHLNIDSPRDVEWAEFLMRRMNRVPIPDMPNDNGKYALHGDNGTVRWTRITDHDGTVEVTA